MVKQWLSTFSFQPLACLLLLFLMFIIACAPKLTLTPSQIASEYVAANKALMNDEFATVVLANPRAEGLTREDIVSRVEWSFMDFSGGTGDRTSVTALGRADIPHEGWRISPIVSFQLLIDRSEGKVLSATTGTNAQITRIQIEGAQPTPEPHPTVASLPKSVLAVLTPTARPRPTRSPPTRTPTAVPQPSPTVEPTLGAEQSPSAVSRALSDSLTSCIWNIAHTDTLPTLPADWLASPHIMEQLEAAGAATPEDLHTTAKYDVLGYDSFEEYSAVAYKVAKGDDSALYTLGLHYLYCNELWQGREATEVTGQDDAVAVVAECVWKMAHSNTLPEVPDGVDNLTPAELEAEARGMTELAVSASEVDASIRAHLDAGRISASIVSNDWHLLFCGSEWTGDE